MSIYIETRSQKAKRPAKADKSPNTSYISVVSGNANEENEERDTLLDLRDKLASANCLIKDLNDENGDLRKKIEYYKNKLFTQTEVVKDLHQTIKDLSSKIKNCQVTHVDTQTDLIDYEFVGTQTDPTGSESINTQTTPSIFSSPVSLCHFNATTSSNHNTYESNEIGLDNRVKPTSEDSPQKLASTSTANRIQIISDSCGRFGSQYLSSILPSNTFQVSTIIKPNASLDNVVKDSPQLCRSFGKNDWIVIMGGTNDCLQGKDLSRKSFESTLSKLCQTNVIVTSVPYLRNNGFCNSKIYNFNCDLYNCIRRLNCGSIHFLDVNYSLCDDHRAKRGIHLSKRGKYCLFKAIANGITYVTNVEYPTLNYCTSHSTGSYVNHDNLIDCNSLKPSTDSFFLSVKRRFNS